MRATPEAAHRVLTTLSAAYPTFPMEEATVELYLRALVEPAADEATLLDAVERWVLDEDRMPTVGQLREVVLGELRRRWDDERDRGAAPEVAVDRATAHRAVEILRDVWKAGRFDPVAVRQAFDDERLFAEVPEPTYRCNWCGDQGMVEKDETGRGTFEPCPHCNVDAYQRWRAGHYRRDHSEGCGECADLRRGKRHAKT